MRYLVLANTPAHVHLYRNAVAELGDRGHEVRVLARDYGCTTALLDWHDLPYDVYGACGHSKLSLLANAPRQFAGVARHARRFDPDLVFGMGAYAAAAGTVARAPVVLVLDSEPTGLDHAISVPLARAVLTPAAFRKDLGAHHYVFAGFKESAYLHPEVFEPRDDVRARLGVGPEEEYVLLRFNAFGSHHDVGEGGFSRRQRRTLVRHLAARATVLVSDEGGDLDLSTLPARAFDLPPALLHDALAEAALLVADTQTMVTEAALLGTPAIRSNSFVGEDDMGNFLELERRGLVENLVAFEDVLDRATAILRDDGTPVRWQRRREAYVAEMENLTRVLVDVARRHEAVGRVEGLSSRSVAAAAGDAGGAETVDG